uniref:RBR-type E3 ubiquitin transferase n=1 Tax=Neogobius melanostomus TaxID=47308 RepID=A0A8C6SVS1_9GOBI
MEDEGPIADQCTMPSFISSFEEGRARLSRTLSTETYLTGNKVETPVIDLNGHVTASDSQLSRGELDRGTEERGAEEGKDAEGNNNNNCNSGGGGGERRRASAVEILLRRNFGTVSKSPSLCLNASTRVWCGTEGDSHRRISATSRDGNERKSSRQETDEAAVQNEHTSSDTADVNEVQIVTNECHNGADDNSSSTLSLNESFDAKEHVYCTVYCIANDENLNDHELPNSIETPAFEQEMYPSSGPEPVLYTLDDLVDPFGDLSHRLSVEQAAAETAAQFCPVCLESKTTMPLPCCALTVCEDCLKLYVSSQVRMAKSYVSCPSPDCTGYLEEGMLLSVLTNEEVARYRYFLELSQLDSSTKPCPQCSHFTSLKTQPPHRSEHKYKIQCDSCQFVWCFKCHAPWHNGLKCKQYRKGDKLLRTWANVIEHGQRNAQKCPRCKIHIQRTEGCDHMTCTQCNTNFCYRCGERYRHLRFFGDHTSNLSVFGCKYRYLPGKPHLRRFVRGSVCATKILIAPVVLVLVVVLGVLALIIGSVAFPIYYVCKRKKKQHSQGSGRWI